MEWVEGATAPGVPFVVLGRTQSLAWSMTSNEADLQDVVRIKAANVDRRIPQTVRVKDGTPQDITLMFSKAAPVIAGTVLDGIGDDGIALLATALSVDDTSPDALARLNRARTIAGGIPVSGTFHECIFSRHPRRHRSGACRRCAETRRLQRTIAVAAG